MKVLLAAGARPNFMKIAPLTSAMDTRGGFRRVLVHTGQHYDREMSRVFFDELGVPRPDLNLEVGSGSHAAQTAEIMRRFEPVVRSERPDLVVVVGDVNSTLACALVAVKLQVPVAHVEAGLRSFDRTMPEEINRKLTDAVSDHLFASEPSGVKNLRDEGVPSERIHLVGNVMIDTLLRHRERAAQGGVLERSSVEPGGYALLTLHRPSNVDDPGVLAGILDALEGIAARIPVLFPVHPRTEAALRRWKLGDRVERMPGLRCSAPLGYLDFLGLMSDSMVTLTDSGGIQEETTALGVPCLTLRERTERPITVEQGTNVVVGSDPDRILAAFDEIQRGEGKRGKVPDLWDGRAAERIVTILSAVEVRERWRDT